MRDHAPVPIEEFEGWFSRGRPEVCPPSHGLEGLNLIYTHLGIKTREGSVTDLTPSLSGATIVRHWEYKKVGEASRLIILDSTGKLWDHIAGFVTPILNIPAMVDVSVLTLFNRLYISPHTGIKGLPGEKVYVYNGVGVARPAAGTPPAGTLIIGHGASGKVERGYHLFGLAYETDSGFITAPGEPLGLINAVGAHKAEVFNITQGPAGTTARHILATKVIQPGLQTNQTIHELFFVPGGKIDNNDAIASFEVDFFDADLLDSADYLRFQFSEIPAFVGLGEYQSSLCGWGEDANGHVVRVSKAQDPESFSDTDGFITTNPGDGGNVSNCVEYRSLFYIFKDQRSFVTQSNGSEPNTWAVQSLDAGKGTSPYGVSVVLDTRGQTEDRFLLADRSGLLIFTGNFSEKQATWKIDDVWSRINLAAFRTIQVLVDPLQARAYISVPLDGATSPNYILMMDYSNEMAAESIRWSLWSFPTLPKSILIRLDPTTLRPYLTWAVGASVYKMDPATLNDSGTAIDCIWSTAFLPTSTDGGVGHCAGIRMRLRGWGTGVGLQVFSADDTNIVTLPDIPLLSVPGREFVRLCNIKSERVRFRFRTFVASTGFEITRLVPFIKPLWKSRPME